ncbi:MAG: hypothetical protein DRG71_07670 [Deltaproteobacteria bacterium]|nr:MAG: hypothetical protein DRG71_07670 [Deltaproteobacteria bacterium]
MAKRKTRVGGLKGAQLDPAVQEWLDTAAENKAALTPKQLRDRRRKRAAYDLPMVLIEAINTIAKWEKCTASGFVAVLLLYGLKLYSKNHIVIPDEYVCDSRSPQYEKVLRISESDLNFLSAFVEEMSEKIEEREKSSRTVP